MIENGFDDDKRKFVLTWRDIDLKVKVAPDGKFF